MNKKSWRNVVIGTAGEEEATSEVVIKGDNKLGSANYGAKIPVAAENDEKRNERLLIVYAPLTGKRVTVFLYDGAVFEGTLDSFETKRNEFSLILRMATMIRPGRESFDPSIRAGITFELMNIRFDDMAELKGASSNSPDGGIGTDSAISNSNSKKNVKGNFGKERELHRWLPEDLSPNSLSLSNSNSTVSEKWDQFAINEKLFGLKTDFDEEMYTTKLDRNSAHIRANEAEAERIAKEISSGSTGGNAHVAEERGIKCDHGLNGSGDEYDEELLYGAVQRTETRRFLPPGFGSLKPNPPVESNLNVDAPEFNPSEIKVTYYNQSHRNLYAGGYYPSPVYSGGGGYPSLPYYYVPPLNDINCNVNGGSAASSSSGTIMNPNAAEFVLPQYQSQDQSHYQYQYQDQYQYQSEDQSGDQDQDQYYYQSQQEPSSYYYQEYSNGDGQYQQGQHQG